MVGSPVNVVCEDFACGRHVVVVGWWNEVFAFFDAHAFIKHVANGYLILFRNAEQHADRSHGHLCAEVWR